MTLTPINDFDIIYISYDEPNADANWHDLLDKCPWAKRSHGVHGSDAAHKAAAKLSETSRFITVDADNIVNPQFFNLEIDMNKIDRSDVISWAAKNEINGLVYGNGGIKCWPKHVVERMQTHEAAPANNPAAQVDFCWNINYIQMNNVYSHVYNNASPMQAWRAGFREGCKMTLVGGDVVDKAQIKNVHYKNLQRLLVWQSVGTDATNGDWARYGARQGSVMTNLQRDDWDWHMVRDFKWLTNFWETNIAPMFAAQDSTNEADICMCPNTGYKWDNTMLTEHSQDLGQRCRDELGLLIADLDTQGSKFFKAVYVNPARVAPMTREEDVINEIKETAND